MPVDKLDYHPRDCHRVRDQVRRYHRDHFHRERAAIVDDSGGCEDCEVREDEVYPSREANTGRRVDDNKDENIADMADDRAAVVHNRKTDEAV